MDDAREKPTTEALTEAMAQAAEMAEAAGLVYVSDNEPGIRRLRHDDGFVYVRPDNRPETNPNVLARIERLNPTLNAFLTVTVVRARADAKAAEALTKVIDELAKLIKEVTDYLR